MVSEVKKWVKYKFVGRTNIDLYMVITSDREFLDFLLSYESGLSLRVQKQFPLIVMDDKGFPNLVLNYTYKFRGKTQMKMLEQEEIDFFAQDLLSQPSQEDFTYIYYLEANPFSSAEIFNIMSSKNQYYNQINTKKLPSVCGKDYLLYDKISGTFGDYKWF